MVILSDLSEVMVRGLHDTGQFFHNRYPAKIAEQYDVRHREMFPAMFDWMRGFITEDEYWDQFFSEGDWTVRSTAKSPAAAKDGGKIGPADGKAAFTWNLKRTIPGTLKVYQRIIRHPAAIRPGAPMRPGLPRLKILSDQAKERKLEVIKNHPQIFRLFEGPFWSCDLGKIKRDPGIFEHILWMLECDAREVVFIDDSADNIRIATELGIPSIRFFSAEVLEKSLAGFGFEFAPATV